MKVGILFIENFVTATSHLGFLCISSSRASKAGIPKLSLGTSKRQRHCVIVMPLLLLNYWQAANLYLGYKKDVLL